ncbi:MAG: Crp/Fnr family transcriptional regulator [Rhodospirillaceae bacterium]|jgi:CRP-like cAMP-binding protein|nr:Crp/Fnr family transcriptional regulator [Rhodospirillaceae bacterium]MBT5245648.1 Crp/Fnr family transcriptional regulator [Rhodospirillaceae bacterium]MBT5561869.1 Crp/Fnr family transcriptional regulator [Rhodospirillaceae bacterium]MBT6240475.1 Crp/Fnr family transcriptional regulator [Rhodospirillaceae bacterium]MBT7136564.1 Crp/Fnr family transcriptional regulator [Rhodospirillaceae bacterium]
MPKKGGDKTSVPVELKCKVEEDSEWRTLNGDQIDLFNAAVICRSYKAGETVFMQDDPCKGLYIIESGMIAVRKMDSDGRTAVIRLGYPGDSLGYRPLLAKENHRASAEVTKDSRVCFVDAKTTWELISKNPDLGLRFLERTAKALGEVESRFFEVAALSVRVRLVHLLILLRDKCGRFSTDGTLILELPLTRQDMASMIGARPESVSRAFHELKEDGLAQSSGRQVHVTEYARLIEELHSNISV